MWEERKWKKKKIRAFNHRVSVISFDIHSHTAAISSKINKRNRIEKSVFILCVTVSSIHNYECECMWNGVWKERMNQSSGKLYLHVTAAVDVDVVAFLYWSHYFYFCWNITQANLTRSSRSVHWAVRMFWNKKRREWEGELVVLIVYNSNL